MQSELMNMKEKIEGSNMKDRELAESRAEASRMEREVQKALRQNNKREERMLNELSGMRD
jgi:hypothetical protein